MKQTKYKSIKTEADGIMFDSKKEANRYKALKLLEKKGIIINFRLQVPFILCQKQIGIDHKGKQIILRREMKYIADFVYYSDRDGTVVEDVKGYKTKEYKQKKNLMKKVYGIDIYES